MTGNSGMDAGVGRMGSISPRSPRNPGRALVALSGGVDSAVAAALLVDRGYEVVGVMLRLWAEKAGRNSSSNRCCTSDAVSRARRVADQLHIPFHLVDVESAFKDHVVDYFVSEYRVGRTPNPCVCCNRAIRFGLLLKRALAWGADFLATGHYARVRCVDGCYQLLRGQDVSKDQSYFLHTLNQEQLARVLFPLGELTKDEVRDLARQRGLPVAEQPESQDICFVADDDYRHFLARCAPHLFRPGPICDVAGRVLGQHEGLPAYTIGQRKGLGIAAQEPLYVLAIDTAENALVVGPADELGQDECLLQNVHYVDGKVPSSPFQAMAQIRYRAPAVPVKVTPLPHRSGCVYFASVQRDITPGQFLVLYQGEVVLGGGTICKTLRPVL